MTDTFAAFRSARPKGSQPKELETAEAPAMEGEVPKDKLTGVKRKPRAVKSAPAPAKKTRRPRPVTLPIAVLPALAGMKEVEAEQLMSILHTLQPLAKPARKRIVAALARVFR